MRARKLGLSGASLHVTMTGTQAQADDCYYVLLVVDAQDRDLDASFSCSATTSKVFTKYGGMGCRLQRVSETISRRVFSPVRPLAFDTNSSFFSLLYPVRAPEDKEVLSEHEDYEEFYPNFTYPVSNSNNVDKLCSFITFRSSEKTRKYMGIVTC